MTSSRRGADAATRAAAPVDGPRTAYDNRRRESPYDRGEKEEQKVMRSTAALLAVVGLVLGLASTATAGAITETTTYKKEPFTEPDVDCFGATASIVGTRSGVDHVTMTEDGGIHVTFTEVGRFTLTSANGTFTGHFAVWGGFNVNNLTHGGTFTF